MYLRGLHLCGARVPSCAFFSRFFWALKQGQTFLQMWQIFLFRALGGLDGVAFFTSEPLGPFLSISSSELVTGSACGEVQLGRVLLLLDPFVGSPRSTWATPWNDSGLSVARVVDALTLLLMSPTGRVGASPRKPSAPLVWGYSLPQSCKNLGSGVALLQGNFEKSHDFKANFEEKRTFCF